MPLPKARHTLRLLTAALLISTLDSSTTWLQIPQALAHQVEVAQEVGGTLHIEPNDMPRAGEEVLAWVALTRKGGQSISLAECNCQINIYRQPELGDDSPIFSSAPLAVKGDASVNASGSIPGIKFTFPQVGTYKLVISGQPKAIASESPQTSETESFAPFELAFDVTVATGEAIPTIPADDTAALPTPESQTSQPQATEAPPKPSLSRQILPWLGLGTAGTLLGWGANLLLRRRR
jgi:hypothetical protein